MNKTFKISQKKVYFTLICFLVIFFSDVGMAKEYASLGSIAETLISGTDAVTKLMHFISITMGVALFIMAISLYKAHRFNPKFVPLERPIIYVLLGIILVALPFFGRIFGPTGSTQDYDKIQLETKGVQTYDIDAPLDWGNDFDH